MTAAVALRLPLVAAEAQRFPDAEECGAAPGVEPCTRTECRYHLAHRDHWGHQLSPTRDCALSVANEGPHTLDEVADMFGLSKERVRQIEANALEKLKNNADLQRHCDTRVSPRSRAIQLARALATSRSEHLCATFANGPSGDAARRLVGHDLRREFPDIPTKVIQRMLDEVLSP